jgi:hypothetical protein
MRHGCWSFNEANGFVIVGNAEKEYGGIFALKRRQTTRHHDTVVPEVLISAAIDSFRDKRSQAAVNRY